MDRASSIITSVQTQGRQTGPFPVGSSWLLILTPGAHMDGVSCPGMSGRAQVRHVLGHRFSRQLGRPGQTEQLGIVDQSFG
eukprot:g77035.t1